jgi:hypothetical protein
LIFASRQAELKPVFASLEGREVLDASHQGVEEQRESLNMTLRRVTKNRALFPNDEAVFKLMYLALRNISKR